MSQAAAKRLYVPESAHVARTFLNELRDVHRHLISQLQALDALSATKEPDSTALTTARWRLGQASLSRRLLAGRICEYFLSRVDGQRVEQLRTLQEADREMLRHSAAHLAKWSAEAIGGNWVGYCRDGNEIRRMTLEHIASEQRVLYPLLEAAARRV